MEHVCQREELLTKVTFFRFCSRSFLCLITFQTLIFLSCLQVESMKKKLPWLKHDMKKAEYMEAKEQEKDAKKKLDEAAKTLNDLKEPIEYDDLSLVYQMCSA